MSSWHKHAACRGLPIEVFYPEHHNQHSYQLARQACESCPVQTDCLEDALQQEAQRPGRLDDEVKGFRGNRTAQQRIDIIRGRKMQRPTSAGRDTAHWWDPPKFKEPAYESPWGHEKNQQRARRRALRANQACDGSDQGTAA